MPDNNRIAELLTQLNEFVAQLKKPGGIPLHPDVPRALDAVAEILALIETPQLDLETIRQDIEALRQTLQEQGADLSLFRDKLGLMASQLEEVFNALADKLDVENAQNLIQQALNPISDAISALDIRLRDLEKMGQGNEGVGVEEVQALIETALAPIRDAIQQLKDREDPRIADLLQRVSDLENQTGAAAGMTLAQTQALIAEAVADIHIRIATLRSELEQKIIVKVAQTDFDHFKSQNQQALNAKASQSDLDETNAALTGKTDNADFEAFKSDAQQQLDAKASQSDLNETNAALAGKTDNADFEAFKSDAEQQLDAKASQSDLDATNAALAGKTDNADFEAFKSDAQQQLDAKADKTELAQCKADIEAELEKKADKDALDNHIQDTADKLDAKADKTELAQCKADIEAELEKKADKDALDNHIQDTADKLDAKADKTELAQCKADIEAELEKKADKDALDNHIQDTGDKLDAKADKTELAQCKADIEAELEKKADKDALDNHIQDTADKLDAKADKTELAQCKADIEAELEKKADKDALDNHIQDTADKLDAKADKTELALCKADIEAELDKKADKDDIVRIDNKLEELAQKWLDDAQNSPGARLARIALQGWGIVGGFDIRSDRKHYVHITPGIGVTPQGVLTIEPRQDNTGLVASGECTEEDLISGSLVFSHYQPFAYEGDCAFFHFEENCPIWEMLPPADDLPDEALPLTPQSEADKEQPFIVDKIILLLPDGDKRHYLLIRREDLLKRLSLSQKCKSKNRNTDYLFEEEYSPEDDFISDKDLWLCLQPAYGLPELSLYRFGFYQNEDCSPDELDVADFPKICSADDIYQIWKPIVDEALRHLTKAVKLLVERYRPLLFPLFNSNQYEKKLNLLTEKWVRFVKYNDAEGGGKGTKPYAQYFYDLARDLMAAYHELRSELIELMNDLRPLTLEMLAKERCFLMLGPALRPAACLDQAPLRDYFHQPPIYNGNANRLDTAKLYFCRLFAMIEGFYLPDYVPKSELPGWCQPDESHEEDIPVIPDFSRLRITPGRSYFYPLSEQTIPFYYPLNDNPKSLQHYWNYRRAKTLSADRLLSYHATDTPPNFPTYSRRRETLRPLHYTLDPHDFYRIEGHIGKTQVKLYGPANHNDQPQEHPVYDALVFLVQKYNLDFAVIRVSVSELQDFSCTQDNLYAIGDGSDPRESAWSFGRSLLGAEHLAGVPKGGTFILVTDDNGCAVADFSLPYRCCPPHDSYDYFSTRS